ncbi:MAG: DNA repair protein RecN [Candidatus Caldatribacteriota bacterium]|jgi:DNA repair protein RecN (Recombination protein N)|nr:DNA repair protein RecN [Atribacterota bacterium]MDD3030890.1 DNA repair protein RecN [Atribacterota bacterium]MDD3640292.1 DNA repair protein RecN [Atribacterota bacterium]MDD4288449.1 DNA repair protein RecN [Atribacterota bacterium]MDD4764348.1 DNA repair protein RecN [Atribacterota bacterium]
MLFYLKVKNFALIDELNIDFHEGLNVITGETGAGKSIIIEAINVILGSMANNNLIKTDADFLEVEALFNLDTISRTHKKILEKLSNIEIDNQLIIKRQVHKKKKNKCWINNQLLPLSLLQKIGNYLIDLHGQHSHQTLLDSDRHIEFVDNLGGSAFLQKRNELYKYYTQWQSKTYLLNKLLKSRAENLSKKDFLLFQLREIEEAKLLTKEDEELENKINIIRHTVKVKEIMEMASLALYEGGEEGESSIRDVVVRLISNFNNIAKLDKNIEQMKNQLTEIQFKVEDIADQIVEYKDRIDFDAQQLQEIESRLDLINHLKKKYGSNLDEIFSYRDSLKKQLDYIKDDQENIEVLKKEVENNEKKLVELSLHLSCQRKIIADKLKKDIVRELNELSMKNCDFQIQITQKEDTKGIRINDKIFKITPMGIDKVEFFITSNIGERPKPLADIISGGEVSRIMLGLKSILSEADEIPTMIFDEIDSGVGARLGEVIAVKLLKISHNHQVIAVTHLPQIACRANRHIFISKYVKKNKTGIELKCLSGDEQLDEIARMIDGEQYGAISLEHAREMLYSKDYLKNDKTE